MRTRFRHELDDVADFKDRLLNWAAGYREVLWLDSNNHKDPYQSFDALLAVGASTSLITEPEGAFSKLKDFRRTHNDWIFGYLSYDLKNDIEELSSEGFDGLGLASMHFFRPEKIIRIKDLCIEFLYLEEFEDHIVDDLDTILAFDRDLPFTEKSSVTLKPRISKKEYINELSNIQAHIKRGDIYEANFCQEFYADDVVLDPIGAFKDLNAISQTPFTAFLKLNGHYALSASPERFLKKTGNSVISQPIKGTARRSPDPLLDQQLRKSLAADQKERAENIMIVDLVRNDLSKYAVRGSVRVEELCEIYSYRQVHQLISTVSARLVRGTDPVDVLKQAFPMGSMTGAPKVSAMKLIEKYETTKRGLFSGAIGYFTPNGDFDFNVVIRSILYNHNRKYISCSVGSAITAQAVAEKEYQECLLKAKAMHQVLEQQDRALMGAD